MTFNRCPFIIEKINFTVNLNIAPAAKPHLSVRKGLNFQQAAEEIVERVGKINNRTNKSLPRRRESIIIKSLWMPASAGMTCRLHMHISTASPR